MLTIKYSPNNLDSIHMNDSDVESFVNNKISTYHELGKPLTSLLIGQESIITQFRVAVKQNLINSADIMIQLNDQLINVHQSGCLYYWPEDFCGFFDNQLDILLDL